MNKPKVVIADDHNVVIKGIIELLGKDFNVIGTFSKADEVSKFLSNNKADLLITDISMPESNGLDYISSYERLYPDLNILVFSMHSDVEYVKKALSLGAKGFILKDATNDVLLDGIQEVSKGNSFFCINTALLLAEGIKNDLKKIDYNNLLTRREKEILKLIADGKSTKQIADTLFLSERTVSSHRYNIMKKLKAKNSADLVRINFENKIV